MKKISVLSIIALICILAFSNCTNNQRKIDGIAKSINEQCPIELSVVTGKIVSVKAMSEKELKANLQIIGTIGSDELIQSLLTKSFKMIFSSMTETNDDFKALKDMDASIILSITNQNNETIDVTITSEDLKNTEKTNLGKKGDEDETRAFIKITSESLKKLLPVIIDKETGIKLIDCYADGMSMIYVLELPEEINETFVSGLKQAMIKMTKNDPKNMELLGKRGATLKLIFKKPDGSIVSEQKVSKTDLD